MILIDIMLVLVSLGLMAVMLRPRLMTMPMWRATVTPLASIIGSGFLVMGPILAHAAGRSAWLAILALCGVAYLFGEAVRYNIAYVEPEIEAGALAHVAWIERASDAALSLAYFVSVAYYLNLFAAFALRIVAVIDPFWIAVASTFAIGGIGLIGFRGGLKGLERLEVGAVGFKLSLIGGLFAGLMVANAMAVWHGQLSWARAGGLHGSKDIQILLGLVILVQGFETSRYLGAEYNPALRVRTMRYAQWLASGIYLTFVLLITAYFKEGLPAQGGETAIIDMLAPLGSLVMPLIIMTALASQLSAGIADLNGAGGLLHETTGKRLSVPMANLATALVAIAITWAADIYAIITYASKLFVVYYALQCVQASLAAYRYHRMARALLFASGIVVALVVVVFAIPADAATG